MAPIKAGALSFPCRRLTRCLGIDFLKNHTERAFTFYLGESDVSKKTTDQQQRPTMLNNPANDFHRNNYSVYRLISQDVWAVSCSSTNLPARCARRLLTPGLSNRSGRSSLRVTSWCWRGMDVAIDAAISNTYLLEFDFSSPYG